MILGGVGWAVPGAVAAPRPCSGILADGNDGFCFQTLDSAIPREGGLLRVLDVLAQDVGVIGVFSDWPATVRFCASFKGLN